MSTMRATIVLVGPFVLVALTVGCMSGSATSARPLSSPPSSTTAWPPGSGERFSLRPLVKLEMAACRRLAASKAIVVFCPTMLPRPSDPATPIGVHTFPVCRALGKGPRCPLYDFAVLYGAPNESPGHGAENTPARFLHFEMLGGRYVLEALGVHGLSGSNRLQRPLGKRTISGLHGQLYFGLPYNQGGGEFGSHYTFIWRQGRIRYAASLHSWTPHRETLDLLAAIIADVAPQPT
jgi:hypothetical protein